MNRLVVLFYLLVLFPVLLGAEWKPISPFLCLSVGCNRSRNPVLDYFDNSELQYEGEAQKENIVNALNDILNLSEEELTMKRYQDYTGKENQWDLPTLIYAHFVPDKKGKTLGKNFYHNVKSNEVQKKIEEFLHQMDSYIPKNLDECFVELEKILTPAQLKEFKNVKEEEVINYHFTLGMWIRNKWGLWSGSRLAKYFNTLGISHPDDMSGIILTSFHRRLNNRDIKLDEQVKFYQSYWEEVKEQEKKTLKQLGLPDKVALIRELTKSESDSSFVVPDVKPSIPDSIVISAISLLENSDRVYATHIGRGGVLTKESWAFNIVLRAEKRIEIFNRLLESKNPVCKSYGICGLFIVAENEFKDGRTKYLQSAFEVTVAIGCLVGNRLSNKEFLSCVE